MNLNFEQKYQLLLEISHKIRDTLDLDVIMEHLLDTIQTVVPYDAAGIFVLSQDLVESQQVSPTNMIAGVCWRGYDPLPNNDDMLTHGKGIIGHVISTKTSLVVPDVHMDERYVEGRSPTQSEVAVPIMLNERAIGALNLESNQLNGYNQGDLEVLEFFADAAAISLERAMLHRQLLEKELLDRQLQIAKDVQMRLLPMAVPLIPGYDIAGVCIPADEIGGDYYDYIQVRQRDLGIAVADISGHGIAPALVMTAFRGLLRMHTQGNLSPARISQKINQMLPEFSGDSHFITMVYGVLDQQNDEITFVSCGHPSPCLLHLDNRLECLASNGPAFGIYSDSHYVNESKVLDKGDILLMYTDGVVDIENTKGEAFGVERLINVVKNNKSMPADILIQNVIHYAQAFSGGQNFDDDFTLVILKKVNHNTQ
jgi:sigma-B regulation protein RsbU (phosphoserine phosphatase)